MPLAVLFTSFRCLPAPAPSPHAAASLVTQVCLESQLEWDECLSLGPYGLHRPLKIHIKKKCHRGKTRADLVLEPTRFYESSGAPVSVDPEQQQMFKGLGAWQRVGPEGQACP